MFIEQVGRVPTRNVELSISRGDRGGVKCCFVVNATAVEVREGKNSSTHGVHEQDNQTNVGEKKVGKAGGQTCQKKKNARWYFINGN